MKLSMQQVEDSYLTVVDESSEEDLESLDKELDEVVYTSSASRKELRTKYLRDRGEVVGHDSSKRRKY